MFFGCNCCGDGDFYWLRRLADSATVNVLAEVDVGKFQNTGDPNRDYPRPRFLTAKNNQITVLSTNNDTNPTLWFRHVYTYDLDLTGVDTLTNTSFSGYSNGNWFVLLNNDQKAYLYDQNAVLKATINIGASDIPLQAVLDSSNNVYVASFQFNAFGFVLQFVTKYNASGVLQWKFTRGGGYGFSGMEIAADDYLWIARDVTSPFAQAVVERMSPSMSITSATFVSLGSTGVCRLASDVANGMWLGFQGSGVGASSYLTRYDSAMTQLLAPASLQFGALQFMDANAGTAVWSSAISGYSTTKTSSTGVLQYTWGGILPSPPVYWHGQPKLCRHASDSVFLCGLRTKKA
jgi:hypothetical protein